MNRTTPWAIVIVVLLVGIASLFSGRGPAGTGEPLVAYDFDATSLPAFFSCMDGRSLLIAAHRGGPSDRRAENALSTLNATILASPALLEVDVSKTSDDVLILFHDDTLDRTTNGTGPVHRPWNELQDLQLRDLSGRITADHIPRLTDVLNWARDRAVLQLDRRGEADWEDIAAAVQRAEMEDRVIAIATSHSEAFRIHRLMPRAMISVPLDSYDDLLQLDARGMPRHLVLAWTGTGDLDPRTYDALNYERIPVIHGIFARADAPFDLPRQVEALARTAHDQGVDILSVNQPAGVWALIQSLDPDAANVSAYQSCLSGAF